MWEGLNTFKIRPGPQNVHYARAWFLKVWYAYHYWHAFFNS